MTPRVFALHRFHDPSGVSGVGTVAYGVEFGDGTVVLRWIGATPSTVVWSDLEAAIRIHGHNGDTRIVWLTGGDDAISRVIAERDRLRDALHEFARRGIHADTRPTIGGRLGDGSDYGRWTRYLEDADRTVRQIARDALDGAP